MKVKQVKLAQALRGETSNILTEDKYEMVFDKGMLHVRKLNNPSKIGPFIVFPANIAYLEHHEEIITSSSSQSEDSTLATPKGRPKK